MLAEDDGDWSPVHLEVKRALKGANSHLSLSLSFLSPQAILIWSLITFMPPTYAGKKYPAWGTVMGWCMITFCLIWIPVVAIYKIVKAKGNLWQVSTAGVVTRR